MWSTISNLFITKLFILRFCLSLWKSSFWVRKGLGDAYNRLIKPWLSRHVRSDLTATAQKEAVKTFTTNLEKYLLTEPIKNRTIMGLDPGFRAGCKVTIDWCLYHDTLMKDLWAVEARQRNTLSDWRLALTTA